MDRDYSALAANGILAASTIPVYGEIRDEWCAEHNPASAKLRVGEGCAGCAARPAGEVYADGPARFELSATLRGERRPPVGGDIDFRRSQSVRRRGLAARDAEADAQGRRALSGASSADLTVSLDAPYGFEISERASRERRPVRARLAGTYRPPSRGLT